MGDWRQENGNRNAENGYPQLEKRHQKPENGDWDVTGARKMKPEARKWKLEGARWTPEGGRSCPSDQYPVPARLVSSDLRAKSLDPPGEPSLE